MEDIGDNIPNYIREVILCFTASQQVGDKEQSDEEGEKKVGRVKRP